jgi:hypothetical protein
MIASSDCAQDKVEREKGMLAVRDEGKEGKGKRETQRQAVLEEKRKCARR